MLNFHENFFQRTISLIPSRSSSFTSSEKFKSVENHPEVEVIPNPPEWKIVERLLPSRVVQIPKLKAEYPSGWTPPNPEKNQKLPYFVARTRNHMVPVYMLTTYRGMRRVTKVRGIEGDIWQLESELHELIEKKSGKICYSRVNEINREIRFKGDYVTLIQKYLISKGL